MSPKTEIFTEIDPNVECKRPARTYPLHDFHKICRVCTPFQDVLAVKISLDLRKMLWAYGDFKLTGVVIPNFSTPPSGETMLQTPKAFEVQERARGPLYHRAKFGGAQCFLPEALRPAQTAGI